MRLSRFAVPNLALLIVIFALVSCGGTVAPTNTVQAPPTSSGGGGGGTTPSSTVLDNVEQSPWLTCGNCGNNGGTGATAAYSTTLGIATPSEDGSSTQFSIAATVPFTNGYFYQIHTPIASQINALTYEFDLYIPQGSESLPQAIEFECQQALDGWVYNFAWQAVYPSNVWRIFNYGAKTWESAGIPFTAFTPGTWHHVLAEYHNDAATHTVLHDALTVDGTRYPVNITHAAFFSGAANNQFTNAFQLDSNSVPAPYSVYVDKMKITYR